MNNIESLKYLGVRIDYSVNKSNFIHHFKEILKKGNSKIYTVNPEFIVDSYFNTDFKKELNSSDLNVIDGVGLLYGIRKYFKKNIPQEKLLNIKTFTGVDLVTETLQVANEKGLSLFLLGGSSLKKTSKKASDYIKKNYPKINLIGYSSEFSFSEIDDLATIDFIHSKMKESNIDEIDILLVAYGHNKQEKWIGRNSYKIPSRVSIGVGGTLDYLSGNLKRAPKIFREYGMEWFYRLLTQPRRIIRIIKATLIFSYLSNTLFKKNFSKK